MQSSPCSGPKEMVCEDGKGRDVQGRSGPYVMPSGEGGASGGVK